MSTVNGFNYVGDGLYHTSNSSQFQEEESLFSLMTLLKGYITSGDSINYKLTMAKIQLSLLQTPQQRTHWILNSLLSKIVVNNELTAMVYQLISEAMVNNDLGKAVDLQYILTQCSLINLDISAESMLVNDRLYINLPLGASYDGVHALSSSIMALPSSSFFSNSASYLNSIS